MSGRPGSGFLILLIAPVLALSLIACGDKGAAPEGGDGFESAWTGGLSKVYPCKLDLAISSAKAALQTLNLRVLDESGSFMKRSLDAEGADGPAVDVDIAEVTKESTRITVKVGWLGDADLSRRVHSEIEAEIKKRRSEGAKFGTFSDLGAAPAPPPPAP